MLKAEDQQHNMPRHAGCADQGDAEMVGTTSQHGTNDAAKVAVLCEKGRTDIDRWMSYNPRKA